jgi:hypothetical protein
VATDDQAPPPYLGDHPHGAYWSAVPLHSDDDSDAADATSASGSVIRLMWDYGVRVPLWDAEGLLPEEPGWLRVALGLSDPLVEDLRRWGLDMEELDANQEKRTEEAYADLDRRARDLARRLQDELGSRYRVDYRPW